MPYVQTLTIEVRVDMMLVIALAVPGHHIPPILSLGGLAVRRTSSSAHRSPTSYTNALNECMTQLRRSRRQVSRRVHRHGLAMCRHAAIHQREGGCGLQASPR